MNETEEFATRVARIMGGSSAAAAALADLERRRADGQEVWIEFGSGIWCVVATIRAYRQGI